MSSKQPHSAGTCSPVARYRQRKPILLWLLAGSAQPGRHADNALPRSLAPWSTAGQAFFTGQEYLYELVKQLSGGR
jgi:hypothetical protein